MAACLHRQYHLQDSLTLRQRTRARRRRSCLVCALSSTAKSHAQEETAAGFTSARRANAQTSTRRTARDNDLYARLVRGSLNYLTTSICIPYRPFCASRRTVQLYAKSKGLRMDARNYKDGEFRRHKMRRCRSWRWSVLSPATAMATAWETKMSTNI